MAKPATTPKPFMASPYVLLTFLLINITWVFFRATTFTGAGPC